MKVSLGGSLRLKREQAGAGRLKSVQGCKQAWRRCFSTPTACWLQKAQTNFIIAIRVWVSPPPVSVLTIQTALTNWKMPFITPNHIPKTLRQRAKRNHSGDSTSHHLQTTQRNFTTDSTILVCGTSTTNRTVSITSFYKHVLLQVYMVVLKKWKEVFHFN